MRLLRQRRQRTSGSTWRTRRRTPGSPPPPRRPGRPRHGRGQRRHRGRPRPVRSPTGGPPPTWHPAASPRPAPAAAWAGRAAASHRRPARRPRRSRSPGPATNRSRQPGPQNQCSTPSTTACGVSGPTVTVIPQTGSTASSGRATARDRGERASPSSRMPRTIAARIDSAISGAVRAPMSRPTWVCTRRRSSSVRSSSASTASPRVWLQTTPTKPTPASSAARMAVGSSPPWLETTAATAPAGRAPVPARSTTKPRGGRERSDRLRGGRCPDEVERRRREQRLEIDLQRSS